MIIVEFPTYFPYKEASSRRFLAIILELEVTLILVWSMLKLFILFIVVQAEWYRIIELQFFNNEHIFFSLIPFIVFLLQEEVMSYSVFKFSKKKIERMINGLQQKLFKIVQNCMNWIVHWPSNFSIGPFYQNQYSEIDQFNTSPSHPMNKNRRDTEVKEKKMWRSSFLHTMWINE